MRVARMLLCFVLALALCISQLLPVSSQQVGVGDSWLGLVTPRSSVTFWQQATSTPSPYHWSVAEVAGSFVTVSLWPDAQGMDHGCAIDTDHALHCWMLGFEALTPEPSGFAAGLQIASVTRGRNHSCVLLTDQRTVQCIGDNTWGQLDVPPFPPGLSVMSLQASIYQSASSPSLTGNSACVLLSDHTPRCWGLGAAVANPLIHPGSTFPPPSTTLWSLDHTSFISCGVRTDGMIQCWPETLAPFNSISLAQPPLSLVVSLSVCAASTTAVTLWAFLNVGPLIKLISGTSRSSAIPWLSSGAGLPDLSGQLVSNHDEVCAAIGSDGSMSVFEGTLTNTLDLSYSRGIVRWAAPSTPLPSGSAAASPAPPVIFILDGGTACCMNAYFCSPVPTDPFVRVTGSLSVAPAVGCDFCALTAAGALHCFGSAATYAPAIPAPYESLAWLDDWLVVVNSAGAIAGVCSAARTGACPVLPPAPSSVRTVDLTSTEPFYMLLRDGSLCSWSAAGSSCVRVTTVPPLLSIANGCGITNASSVVCFAPAMDGSGWGSLPPLAYTSVVATDSSICALAIQGQLLCSSGPAGSPPPFPLNGPYAQMISDGSEVMCLVLSTGQLYCVGSGVPSLTIVPAGSTLAPGTFTQGALQQPCPLGSVSLSGVASSWLCSGLCSAGRYSLPNEPVPATATCLHVCPRGSYCEMGTLAPVDCPAGRYGSAEGQVDAGCSGSCPFGYYCPAGSISPTANPCPSGRYGNTTSTDAYCSGNCTRGYSCPAGTIQPDLLPCGNAAIICPSATTNAIVPPGSYSICPVNRETNTTDYTRCYAQALCKRGHFCVAGYSNPCQPGFWQSEPGTTACAQCAPGTFTDGTAATVCKQCAAGSFSTRLGTVECSLCAPGSISPGLGLAVPCTECLAGHQSSADRTNCTRCPVNTYSGPGAAVCLNCDTAVTIDQSSCVPSGCEAGTEFIHSVEVGNTCWRCPIGLSSTAGGPCTLCPSSRFGPQEQSPVCLDCSDAPGLLCAGGVASVLPGFWAYKVAVSDIYTSNNASCSPDLKSTQCLFHTFGYATAACPSEDYCPGLRALQIAGDINSITGNYTAGVGDLSPCVYPRSTAPSNYLCGQCADGFSPWGDACLRCTSVNGALVFLSVLISALILFFLYQTSGGSNGLLLIALFFAQTAMVQVGQVQSALSWLRFVNLDLKSSSQIVQGCPFPIGEYALVMADVLMPVILLSELAVGFVLHFVVAKVRKRCKQSAAARGQGISTATASDDEAEPEWPSLWSRWEEHIKSVDAEFEAAEHVHAPPSNPELSMSPRSASRAIKIAAEEQPPPLHPPRPSPDLGRYLQTARSVLEFSYTQVTAACLRYVSCASVDGASVVFAQPSLRCDSAEWRSTLILVVVVLFVYVIAWPLMVLAVGWAQRRRAQWLELNAFGAAEVAAVTARPSLLVRLLSASSSIYHQPSWYWSALFLFRRVVILLIDSFSLSHYSLRVVLFSNVHLLSLLLHLNRRPFIEERLNQLEGVSLLLLTWISLVLCVGSPPFTLLQQLFLCFLILPAVAVMFTLALNKAVRAHAGKVTGKILSISTAVVQRMRSRRHKRGGTADATSPRSPRSARSDSDASFSSAGTPMQLGSPPTHSSMQMQMQERLMDTETSAI